jgi:carboxyl-terminal processing protease
MKSSSHWLRVTGRFHVYVAAAIIFVAGFALGNLTGPAMAQNSANFTHEEEALFQPLLETYQLILNQYVDPYDAVFTPQQLLDGAIAGMIDALGDQYSGYMNPETYAMQNSELSGQFEGIGVVIRVNEERGGIEVVNVLAGSPAELSGVQVGDIFRMVDGVDVSEDTNLELAAKVRGPAGTDVSITFERDDELIELTITRARISIPNIEYSLLDGTNIAYLRLNQFTSDARNQIDEALAELDINNRDGLIFDLRGNPGGLLTSAIDVTSAFIESGTILIEDFGSNRDEIVFEATGNFSGIAVPLVVLVDETSASASELVSGALQDTQNAIIIGETTLGKGTVQTWRSLSNGGGIRLTIARWLTPARNWIHGAGVTPDIIVEWQPENGSDIGGPDDPQLSAAITHLQTSRVIEVIEKQ